MKPALHIVREPEVVDITLAMRREIMARDWAAVHIAGDRRKPIELADTRRLWRQF